jgi:hypothetical protein
VAKIVVEIPESCKHMVDPIRQFVARVEALARPGRRARDFGGVEEEVASSVAKIECAALGEILRGLDEPSDVVTCDGARWTCIGVVDKTYLSAAGEVTIERRLFRKQGVHNGPTLDVVGARAGVVGDGWLPATAKAMAYLLQDGPPRQAWQTARQMMRLPYSRSSIERVGHRVGQLYVERHLDIEGELVEEWTVPDEAKSISVALDRVSVPMQELVITKAAEEKVTRAWHMAYVGALTLHDQEGKAIDTLRYARMPEGDIDSMAQSLEADLRHALSMRPDLVAVKLADGAVEMRRRLDEIVDGTVDDAVDLVDYWHVVEKVGAAAQAFTRSGLEAKHMTSLWQSWLLNHDDGAERVLAVLRRNTGRKAVDEAITYLDNNLTRMRYADARRRGLPIGSGNVEASCKTIVRQRMNRGGARWKHEPGERVLHLRALAQSDRWDAGITRALRPLRKVVKRAA